MKVQVGMAPPPPSAPDTPPSRGAEPGREPSTVASALSAHDIAVLTVARKRTLRRKLAGNLTCPGSIAPNVGWWAQANWNATAVDAQYGGPWTVELVADLCARGLLGVRPEPGDKAEITKAGRRALKATEEGSRTSADTREAQGVSPERLAQKDNPAPLSEKDQANG